MHDMNKWVSIRACKHTCEHYGHTKATRNKLPGDCKGYSTPYRNKARVRCLYRRPECGTVTYRDTVSFRNRLETETVSQFRIAADRARPSSMSHLTVHHIIGLTYRRVTGACVKSCKNRFPFLVSVPATRQDVLLSTPLLWDVVMREGVNFE